MNRIFIEIENCCDCPYSYIERIWTPDPFEQEEGVYCSKIKDENSYNGKHKIIILNDWDNLREKIQIPNWCPLLN